MALTAEQTIVAYMTFLDQTHATTMAVVQSGDLWLLQLNGNTIYSLPDQAIARRLLTGFQAGAGPGIVRAQDDSKAAIIALVPTL